MKKQNKKISKKSPLGKITAIGAGMALAGAGAYYFLGPDGKKHQKEAVKWSLKMQKEAEKKIKEIKNVSEPVYNEVVDTLKKIYQEKYINNKSEIDEWANKLKKEWKKAEKKVKPKAKKNSPKKRKK
ncbi:MAG: hypothetical protein WCX79_03970 [Candidatus Paceibacterota bacterium]|jgi:gas vesicle protein